MIQLSAVLWAGAILFAFVGFSRGLSKEMISLSGIILGLFALHQYDDLVRGVLLANLPADQKFYVQSAIFILIVFFAYQTRAFVGTDAARVRTSGSPEGRDNLQASVLGGIIGFINGYLILGTIWYFLDINRLPNGNLYPLDPYIVAPVSGSPSAEAVSTLPLYVLAGGPSGSGDLLALAVIILFLIVLVVI